LNYFIGFTVILYIFYIISFNVTQGHFFLFLSSTFVLRMYNLRARARTALSGAARTQGVGVRGSQNLSSQVTPTQALQILSTNKENVPETEITLSDACEVSVVSADQTVAENTIKSGAATQPPIHTNITHSEVTPAHLDFTIVFGRGSSPDPAGRAHDAAQIP